MESFGKTMELHLEQGIVLDECTKLHFTCANMRAYSSSFKYQNSKEPQLNHKVLMVNNVRKKSFNKLLPSLDSTVVGPSHLSGIIMEL